MSRHAAATNAGRARTLQRTAPAVPRRVSGPTAPNRRDDARRAAPAPQGRAPRASQARAPRARIDASALAYADAALAPSAHAVLAPRTARTFAAPHPRRLAYGGVAIASRVASVAVDVSASRMMDRLVRSRVWIGIVAFCLIGLVAMQVSLLKLNSGIGRAVQTSSTLERTNSSLRAELSRLSSGDRIQKLAEADGMVMPAPSDVTYLRAGAAREVAVRAAQRMHAPDPSVPAGPAGAAIESTSPVAAVAPPTTTPTATAPAPTATVTAPAAPAATPLLAPSSTATAPATGAPPAAVTAAPAAATSGGASPQATPTTP